MGVPRFFLLSFPRPSATIRQPVVYTTFLAGVAFRAGRRESRKENRFLCFVLDSGSWAGMTIRETWVVIEPQNSGAVEV